MQKKHLFIISMILNARTHDYSFIVFQMQMWTFLLRSPSKLWGPFFADRNRIFLLDKVLKFGVIFQKYALKLLKIWEFKKNAKFSLKIIFNFRARLGDKQEFLYRYWGYNWSWGLIFNNLIEIAHLKFEVLLTVKLFLRWFGQT